MQPPSHKAPAPHTHAKPLVVGVLDLPKMSKMFLRAAWWVVQDHDISTFETSAFEEDWRVIFMHTAIPLTNLYHPTVMGVNVDATRINHNTHVVAADFQKIFLDTLHERGPVAANVYAAGVNARSQAAQHRVLALYKRVRDHNAEVAHQAGEIAHYLSDTIFACEIALAIGTCVLTFGAPAFLAGGATVATQAGAGTLISLGYSFAATAVKEPKPDRLQGVAISDGLLGLGVGTDKAKEKLKEELIHKARVHYQARAQVAKLNAKLAGKLKASKMRNNLKALQKAGATMAKTEEEFHKLAKWKAAAAHAGKVMPFVQLAYDGFSAFKEWGERNEALDD